MLELSRLFHRLAPGRHAVSWLLCAALVFGAGIACTNDPFGADTGDTGDTGIVDANVEGTWSVAQTITPGGCSPTVDRNQMAIDQTGNGLVFMFIGPALGFARGVVSGSGVDIDFEYATPTKTTTLKGALVVSDDGTQMTGDVTYAITAGGGGPCTQLENWTATHTSPTLPPAVPGLFGDVWDVDVVDQDSLCPSGEAATKLLTINQNLDGSVTIQGFTSAPVVNGFVTGVFLRATWPENVGGTSKIFDAVFHHQSFPTALIFGDVAHSVTTGGSSCQGQDSYEGQPD